MVKIGWRIWLLIILFIVAILFIINWQYFSGKVIIKGIQANSTAAEAGIAIGEIIKEINGKQINSIEDYCEAVAYLPAAPEPKPPNQNKTNETTNKTKNGNEEEQKEKITILTDKQEYVFLTTSDTGITVSEISITRLKMGLDLQGGARALVKPERSLNAQEMASLLETVRYRLNVYGLTDINVKEVSDLAGERFMMVELAGATPQELQDLIGKQGKFEARIGNKTVFVGGQNDITFVCRNDASCAYIEQCGEIEGGQACRFHFEIHLSEQAAKKHAELTAGLEENVSDGERYLNETLDLYLDDNLVDTLLIDAGLKGQETTRIAITGSGVGETRAQAYEAAQDNMKKLQTVLITGSLPFKLEIVKLDSVSPLLGREFTKNVFIVAIAVFLAVCLIIYLRYRKFILVLPVIITLISEALLVLAIAAVIKWNLDLASIAGIIAALGTGVDDQIIMIDETRVSKQFSIKERIKRAFFMIFAAYATTALALLPLWSAGAGLLRGFVVTTLLGITVGVFITRPAFADILRKITKE
ncbi:MAG: hypothetical protein IB618_02750 [Candidatus Pacearchaeota archaeon]|nr:MAG: hypothetical protein IB618_02750 [Candidatus Pacearchaeota archaeon]